MNEGGGFPPDFQLVLASRSARRHSLLRDIGIPFMVALSDACEQSGGGSAACLAQANALAKVRGVTMPPGARPGAFILGTDTVVSVGRKVLGKPGSAAEAKQMLRALSGRSHRVVSGVALARTAGAVVAGGREETRVASAVTRVTFGRLAEAQVEAYAASGEWRDKAGGYAVQGSAALFVRGLRGEYSNVVGLPLHLLCELFEELGFDLVRREWSREAV
jgi:septum formation protein